MTALRTIGIITARGGSKGIPRKNIALLGGKPLLCHMLESVLQSKHLTRCIVSTDDEEIAAVAREAGGDVPFLRPAELARDDTRDLPVLQHAVKWLREHDGQEYDAVMMLHPTTPFCTADDIDACIRIMEQTDADSVMSMVDIPDFAPEKLKVIENGRILPLLEEERKETKPRSEGTRVYKRNAGIYLTKTALIMEGDLFGNVSMAHVMPGERSVDINTPFDLAFAEFLLSRHGA